MLCIVLYKILPFSEMRKGLKLSKELNSVKLFLLQRKLFVMVFCSALRSDRAGVQSGELPGVGAIS